MPALAASGASAVPVAKSTIPKYSVVPSGTLFGMSSMLNGAWISSTRVTSAMGTAKREYPGAAVSSVWNGSGCDGSSGRMVSDKAIAAALGL